MIPAATALAQTVAASRRSALSAGFSRTDAPGWWAPERGRAAGTGSWYSRVPEKPVQDQTVVLSGLWSKSAEPPEGTTGSRSAGQSPPRYDGMQAAQDGGVGRDRRQLDDRSNHRQEDRSGNAAPVAAARGRGPELEARPTAAKATAARTPIPSSWIDVPTPAMGRRATHEPIRWSSTRRSIFEPAFGSGATAEERMARICGRTAASSTRCSASCRAFEKTWARKTSASSAAIPTRFARIERRIEIAAASPTKCP